VHSAKAPAQVPGDASKAVALGQQVVHQLVMAAGALGKPPGRLPLPLLGGWWLLRLVVLLDGPSGSVGRS
jgi:hypothetical protein